MNQFNINLSPEQQALIPLYGEKWRQIAIQLGPIDSQKASLSVKKLYRLMGWKEPEVIFVESPRAACDYFFISLMGDRLNSLTVRQIKKQLESLLGRALVSQIRGQFIGSLKQNFIWLSYYSRYREWIILQNQMESWVSRRTRSPSQFLQPELETYLQSKLKNFHWRQVKSKLRNFIYQGIIPEYVATDCCWGDYYFSVINGTGDRFAWEAFKALVSSCGWVDPFEKVCVVCVKRSYRDSESPPPPLF